MASEGTRVNKTGHAGVNMHKHLLSYSTKNTLNSECISTHLVTVVKRKLRFPSTTALSTSGYSAQQTTHDPQRRVPSHKFEYVAPCPKIQTETLARHTFYKQRHTRTHISARSHTRAHTSKFWHGLANYLYVPIDFSIVMSLSTTWMACDVMHICGVPDACSVVVTGNAIEKKTGLSCRTSSMSSCVFVVLGAKA